MDFLFVNRAPRKIGSSRIWVYDLCESLQEAGHRAIIRPVPEAGQYDVVFLGKGGFSPDIAKEAKKLNHGALVGWINPSISPRDDPASVQERLNEVDFFIVGSIEERDSLLPYKESIFILPLVERIYTQKKTHTDHEPIVLGYHGNAVHLTELHPHAAEAIEILSKEVPLRLVAIHPPMRDWEWTKGRPDIEVEQVPWDIDTIEEQLLRCDIGIVPGITPIGGSERMEALRILDGSRDRDSISGYDTDYLLRFKNKSNAGRSFVFHQLHIPVVAAFMPSHFHILGNPECGFLAHSTQGWLDGLRTLARSSETRTKMAEAAAAEFRRLYDPRMWIQRLFADLEKIAGC